LLLHASFIEFIWFVIVLCGVSFKIMLVIAARRDYLRTRSSDVPTQRFMTRVIYTSSRVMLAAHSGLLYASTWSLFHAPPPPPVWEVQTMNTVFGCIATSCLLTVHAFLGWRWRRQLTFGDLSHEPYHGPERRK
jgi:hypothetical protein